MNEIVIRRIGPSDGAVLRRVRLQALEADPTSFGSTYEREAAFTDETWAASAARNASGDEMAILLALRHEEAVGLVGAWRDDDRADLFHIFTMWVAPETRRRGIGRRLLDAIEEWIASCGGTSAQLFVTDTATAAAQLYDRAGYARDGTVVASEHTPGLTEISMVKDLGNR